MASGSLTAPKISKHANIGLFTVRWFCIPEYYPRKRRPKPTSKLLQLQTRSGAIIGYHGASAAAPLILWQFTARIVHAITGRTKRSGAYRIRETARNRHTRFTDNALPGPRRKRHQPTNVISQHMKSLLKSTYSKTKLLIVLFAFSCGSLMMAQAERYPFVIHWSGAFRPTGSWYPV
jgi:hypothetical protein